MSCSPARLAANKMNALKSRGPTSDEGKQRSRANAMTHGLAAETLRTPEEQAVATAAETESPSSIPLKVWLAGEIAVITGRIDRAHQAEDRERDHAALRAETCWDEDRTREANRIGRGLGRNPERVVGRLKETVQGCAWLIVRWTVLQELAGQDGGWTPEHQRLAQDLRGLPEILRTTVADPDDQATLAVRELHKLTALHDRQLPSDAFERETTRRKLADNASPDLRRILRYEAALHRRLRWCMDQLGTGRTSLPVPSKPTPPPPSPPAEAVEAPENPYSIEAMEEFAELEAQLAIEFPDFADHYSKLTLPPTPEGRSLRMPSR